MTALKIILWILCALIGLIVLNFIVAAISAYLVDTKKEYYKRSPYYSLLLAEAAWIGIIFGRVKVHATGLEKVPDGKFVYTGNHRSNFDPIVAYTYLPKNHLAFLSKEGNFHILLYGRIIRRCCFLEIDREDPKKAVATIKKAAELIEDGQVSIGVYPEGTRNTTDEPLLPFHSGVYKVAQKAHVPIVVATTKNTEMISKNFPLKTTHVYFDILEVIPAEYVDTHTSSEIGDRVREIMLQNLSKDSCK